MSGLLIGTVPNYYGRIDIVRWATNKKITLPPSFRQTPEMEKHYLKILSFSQAFIKLTPEQKAIRFREAVQEAKMLISSTGLSDRDLLIIQVAGIVFLFIATTLPFAKL